MDYKVGADAHIRPEKGMENINLRKLVDKYVPNKWEKEIVIPKSFKC